MLFALGVLLCGLLVFPHDSQYARAEGREIFVYFEGESLEFEDTKPVISNGRTLVPFRKIFETLGFEVDWIDGDVRKAIGKKDGLTIELTIDSNKAKINGKTVELDVPAQILKGRTLVPLRFVSENSGYHVFFADEGGTFIIGIGETEESANPGAAKPPTSTDKAEPYVVKGKVLDSQGKPLPWAEVYADNTFLYNSNILTMSDEKGNYRTELPLANTTYRMGAKYEAEYAGELYTFYMEPKPDQPFSASSGAVRDFILNINTGQIELHSWDYAYPDDEEAPMFEMHEVELTLKPVGKLIDGTTGNVIIGYPVYEDGARLMDIPFGTYEATAVWKPKGYKAVPLLIGIRHTELYEESVAFTFEAVSSYYHRVQLEVEFPK